MLERGYYTFPSNITGGWAEAGNVPARVQGTHCFILSWRIDRQTDDIHMLNAEITGLKTQNNKIYVTGTNNSYAGMGFDVIFAKEYVYN